ncbi:23S rRNA (uracil(1939)-C(5))-methyltransferase RlmD, partial [Gemmatimonadota bacterium]
MRSRFFSFLSVLPDEGERASLPGMSALKKREVIELEIGSLAFGGRGVGRTDEGMTVFVDDALPGQQVSAMIHKVKKRYAEARLVEVLRNSPDEDEPRCIHFGICGGCRLQHLKYEAQLREKGDQVREALRRLGGFRDLETEPVLPSPRIYGYRNKMEYSFGHARWLTPVEMQDPESVPDRDFGLGLHPRGQWYRTLHLTECHLPAPLSVEILKKVQEAVPNGTMKPYNTRGHTGFWRFLTVREGVRTGQWLVDIITSDEPGGDGEVATLAIQLKAAFPEITTITHTISRAKANVATGEEERVLVGPGYIEDQVGGLTFRISPRAFFQTNTGGCELLYETAVRLAGLTGTERVYDIFCGTGTIALLMASRAREVVGIERVAPAVVDAAANAELNGITNARFVQGDATILLRDGAVFGEPDVVVLDPPRAGLHPDLRTVIPTLGADRIVYVSCNPTTLAADLKEICGNHYRIEVVQPI